MNKLEVLRTFRQYYKAARHEEAQMRYARVVLCLLSENERSLWQEYSWYVGMHRLYDGAHDYGFSLREVRRMRKYYRKNLATIAQALCWLGEWKQQQSLRKEGGR